MCERWVCRSHRHGYGNWFRCERCPYSAMAEIIQAHHAQLRADYRAQQAALLKRAFVRRRGVVLPLVVIPP